MCDLTIKMLVVSHRLVGPVDVLLTDTADHINRNVSCQGGLNPKRVSSALARLLSDPALDDALACAQDLYVRRRPAAKAVLAKYLGSVSGIVKGDDGLNLWVQFSPGTDAGIVIERAGGDRQDQSGPCR